jgi:phage/plasmid-like protein (TIGR03299 family)
MAHELSKASGTIEMAYTGSTPWHGLGTKVDHAMNAEEALTAANLDWTVSLEPLLFSSPNGPQEIYGHSAVVRNDVHRAVGVVRSRYEPLQNKDALAWLDSLVPNGVQFHTLGALFGGRKIWALMKLPETIKVIGTDIVEQYLLFTNAHDGSQTVKLAYTPIRVVCNNTLQQAEFSVQKYLFSCKHTQSMPTKLTKAKDLFLDLSKQRKDFETAAQRMVLTPLSKQDDVDRFLYSVLGYGKEYAENTIEDISTRAKNTVIQIKDLAEQGKGTDIVGVRGSLWGYYNAVTEYADYFATVKHDDPNIRLDSMWFGTLGKMKESAWNNAQALLV